MVKAEEHGARLFDALRSRTPIPPISESEPGLTVADAYEIQGHFVRRLLSEGGSVVGYKLGLTSKPMQELFGVHEPDFGPILSTMIHRSGVQLELAGFLQPRIEAEIALVLDRPLAGPGVTRADVAGAVRGAIAALELVDSRIADWKITIVDTVADLASSSAIVLAADEVKVEGFDPRLVGMVVERNDELEATGAGAAALGDPYAAVAWLANTLAPFGDSLDAGHLIMTGSLHRAFAVEVGDRVLASFDRLGGVECAFV